MITSLKITNLKGFEDYLINFSRLNLLETENGVASKHLTFGWPSPRSDGLLNISTSAFSLKAARRISY
jgi:hypothetical protein